MRERIARDRLNDLTTTDEPEVAVWQKDGARSAQQDFVRILR